MSKEIHETADSNDNDPFDGWDPDQRTPILGKEIRDRLLASSEPFTVHSIDAFDTRFGKKAFVEITTQEGERGTITFAIDETVPTRDRVLRKLWTWLNRHPDKTFKAKLWTTGRVNLIVPATWEPTTAVEPEDVSTKGKR